MKEDINSNEFILKLKQADQAAWKIFVEQYQDKLYQTAYSFTRSSDLAADLVQEIFLVVFQKIYSFRQQSHIGTWLYRIATNVAINYVRKNSRHFVEKSEFNLEKLTEQFKSPSADFIQEQKEKQKQIYQALIKLPPRQMKVFVLHKINGMSYREIAEILNISVSSVESLIHRARKNLQKKLYAVYTKKF